MNELNHNYHENIGNFLTSFNKKYVSFLILLTSTISQGRLVRNQFYVDVVVLFKENKQCGCLALIPASRSMFNTVRALDPLLLAPLSVLAVSAGVRRLLCRCGTRINASSRRYVTRIQPDIRRSSLVSVVRRRYCNLDFVDLYTWRWFATWRCVFPSSSIRTASKRWLFEPKVFIFRKLTRFDWLILYFLQ